MVVLAIASRLRRLRKSRALGESQLRQSLRTFARLACNYEADDARGVGKECIGDGVMLF